MNRHRAAVRALVVAVTLTLVGCTDQPAPAPTATTVAPTTSATAPQAADCPLGDARCPRPKVTPGAVVLSSAGVCTTSYNPRRSLTAAGKRRVLAAYGLPSGAKVYEWDHLVARWAGGTSTSSNVWPMTNDADQGRKDRLEQRLYYDVCRDRDVELVEARQRMREFWKWY